MREQREQGSRSAKAGRRGEKLAQRGKNYNKKTKTRGKGGTQNERAFSKKCKNQK